MPSIPTSIPWGVLPDGRPVRLFTLAAGALRADISDFGGLLVRLLVPDRQGVLADVVLGFPTLEDYLRPGYSPYFGCLIGRVGNRIAHGRFTLDGREYRLVTNNTPGGIPCHLHGGNVGFDKVLWEAEPFVEPEAAGLRLRYLSRDGEEGYSGNLAVVVEYRLTTSGDLSVLYQATTDAPTPVNLTQHTYFNLAGEASGDVLAQELQVHAEELLPVDAGLIPLGHGQPVQGTPFDFRQPQPVGARIDAADPQLMAGAGYDHTWIITGVPGTLRPAAVLREPVNGRTMEVLTTEPGVQVYSGNYIAGEGQPVRLGKSGRAYPRRAGICLETQHFPDALNQPAFASIVLRPGRAYRTETVFRFRVS